jgi:hypothetical protein
VAAFHRFFHAMLERGACLAPSAFETGFVSTAHSEQGIAATLDAACGIQARRLGTSFPQKREFTHPSFPRKRESSSCSAFCSVEKHYRQRLDDVRQSCRLPFGPFAARMFASASLPSQSSFRWNDERVSWLP